MANEDNNNTDPLLQNLVSPRINPPPALLPLQEHNDVDVVVPMPVTSSELKDQLVFGTYPPSVFSQNPSSSSSATTSSSNHSTVKPKSTHHGRNRSRPAPDMAAINDLTHSTDHVSYRPISDSKSTVRKSVALLIVYLLVMSVATVVYGDHALKTLPGWLLAVIWLLVSTLAVALAFLFLAKARMAKRNRDWANRVLGENMSISQFFAADIEGNGYLSKSEYALYKLMEMGKISHLDMERIAKQFEKLDRTNIGKITLLDLLETNTNDLSTATSSLRTNITT